MSTITINWLNKCRCGNKSHTVKTVRGNETGLWDDDAVKCNSCGRGGVIQVCEGQARVLWETDEEMAEGKSMSTITRELAKLFRKITNSEIDAEGNAHVVLSPADSLLINNARIALASLEVEPVAYMTYKGYLLHAADPKLAEYSDPTPLYTAPPAPVSVPAAMEMDDDFDSAFEHGKAVGWNAYRAAMLQAEPASNSDELPPDYLQGHKDGLEWAAQLAEANHPQTGDWLYDDPIELARAIRKGPDMPTVQDGKSPVAPGAWIPVSERMPEAEGRYWCYVEEQNCLGKSHYQWNCSWNGERWWVESDNGGRVTHWMELPAAPQQDVKSALEHGMQRYAGAMQKLSEGDD